YWDWTDPSTGKEGIPDLLKPKEVELNLPDGGTQILKNNPLATYKFENPRPDGFANIQNSGKDPWTPFLRGETAFFKDWTSTYRWPTSELEPMEQYNLLNQLLIDDDKINRYGWRTLRSNVAHIFTFPLTTKADRGFKDYKAGKINCQVASFLLIFFMIGSVEHSHNSVHLLLGGLGHMSNNDYAGFDPIFYLH
ncbi:hypothetical protein GYMLUDRAFT_140416, partial [Collybiopsis luxurians FD-317 M1]